MKSLIILACFLSLGSCQFQNFDPYLTTTEPTRPIWNGPLANHVSGLPPPDTPEVAAAKSQLRQAYSHVLAVLPTLAPEVRYQKNGILLPQHPQPIQQQPFQQQPIQQQPFPQQTFQPDYQQPIVEPQPVHNSPQFTQFAEEIPRSRIGEVPEVHAARVAFLKAYQDTLASLPPLKN
ncbi:unnamed protein product [Brassicogethes aeneus]|uniref:Uncharacterized protein n=1 Tax=Brassicogethes aeneus TaxID=1431903 RepID=A0A9P0BC96_BRAAE|nr:unnamed protein product [Brassicogethes aeneus]